MLCPALLTLRSLQKTASGSLVSKPTGRETHKLYSPRVRAELSSQHVAVRQRRLLLSRHMISTYITADPFPSRAIEQMNSVFAFRPEHEPLRTVGRLSAFTTFCSIVASPVGASPQPACTVSDVQRSAPASVSIGDLAETEGRFRKLRVSAAYGAHMLIYFDQGSESVARSHAACLGAQLSRLRTELGDDRRNAEWASVVFTQDMKYAPPRGVGVKTRWIVHVDPAGRLPALSKRLITSAIPHEQVHEFQTRSGSRTLRWFAEGHAQWVGTKIFASIDPTAARADKTKRHADLAASTVPPNLAEWESVRPRREAILRQVSPEDRARMEADPSYSPSGAFTFTTDDFIGDESNMPARYAASWSVFEGLEKRHGAKAVRVWAAEVTSVSGRITPEVMAKSVQRHFGESMDHLLTAIKGGTDRRTVRASLN